jgi:hypothetical protein
MRERGRAARLLFWVTIAGLAGAGAHYALTKSMHHDVAYYVNAVERWLGGARLYRDLIDVNVPTIYWLMSAPVWAARQLGVEATTVFNIFVLILAALSVAAVWHTARLTLRSEGLLPDALAGAFALWFFILVGHNFGQREHLATILLAPYAVIRAGLPPARPRLGLRLLIGLAAGVAAALKPFFAFIVIGMEGALLLRRGWRSWRPGPESAAAFLAAAACAAGTLLFLPEYLSDVVPLARATYHGYERPPLEILATSTGPRTLVCLLLGLLAIPLARTLEPRTADVVAILLGAGLGGYASFLLQSKGWIYQLTPALAFSSAAFVAAAAGRGERSLATRSIAASTAIGIVLGLAAIGTLADLARSYRSDEHLRSSYAPLIETLRDQAQGGPALFISLDVDYTFPAVNYAGAAYPYRWHHLLPMPGLYQGFAAEPGARHWRKPEEMGAIERAFFDSFIEDAVAHPPRIILIDRRPVARPGFAADLDLLAYFCQSPRFAQLVSGYGWLGRRANYDALTPRRAPPGAPGPCAEPPPQPGPDPSS